MAYRETPEKVSLEQIWGTVHRLKSCINPKLQFKFYIDSIWGLVHLDVGIWMYVNCESLVGIILWKYVVFVVKCYNAHTINAYRLLFNTFSYPVSITICRPWTLPYKPALWVSFYATDFQNKSELSYIHRVLRGVFLVVNISLKFR